MKKVVLGLSGGVDSSVAAELLKKEYELVGLYLDTGAAGGIEAAQRAADFSKIPLRVRDVRRALEERVCAPFAACYLRGETPNPCVLCNPAVKLRALEELADELGADYIATGHYARKRGERIAMGRAENDQSYMLCRVTRAQSARLLLPLGGYSKAEVRQTAQRMALPASDSPDSMEICFIPDNDYAAWLESRGQTSPAGEYWYHGRCVGRHGGVFRCTVGQHRNLGVALGKKVYVSRIDAENARVYLSDAEELMKRRVRVRNCVWLTDVPEQFEAAVRIRHTRNAPTPCTVQKTADGGAELVCREDVRAPSPGQTAALYDENGLLLGGGFIVCGE